MLQTTVTVPQMAPLDLAETILAGFMEAAGPEVVAAIRSVLGTSEMDLTLSEPYATRKIEGKTNPEMKVYAGKEPDQPGILSGNLYDAVEWTREGVVLCVGVKDDAGLAGDGEDYAEALQDRTHYLDTAHEQVEPDLQVIMDRVTASAVMEKFGA